MDNVNIPLLPLLDNASVRTYLARHPDWEEVTEARLPYTGQAWEYTPSMGRGGRVIELLIHKDPSKSPRSEEYLKKAYRIIGYLHLGLPEDTPFEAVRRLVFIALLSAPGSDIRRIAMGAD